MSLAASTNPRRMSGPGIHECPVVQIDEVARGIFLMQLENPAISRLAAPGQFVNVRVRDESTPLLRRPFSICRVNRDAGTFELLWRVYGLGTKLMTQARRGDCFDILGPLGNGFSLPASIKHALVVAGGLGVAPMPFLLDSLVARQVHVRVQIGARTGGELWGEEIFRSLGAEVAVATDDGSRGHKGVVTALLEQEIQSGRIGEVFACGPMPMLAKVAGICHEARIAAQLSVETVMGCGFGICMGCPMIPTSGVKEHGRYLLACVDGPVFRAGEVMLHG